MPNTVAFTLAPFTGVHTQSMPTAKTLSVSDSRLATCPE